MKAERNRQEGFTLIAVLMVAAVLAALIAGYFSLTRIEMTSVDSSMDSIRGFYAAEAGSNIRAELVRQTFVGYNRPSGVSPVEGELMPPCDGSNLGSGDFACNFFAFQGREVLTYLNEEAGNPTAIVIPRGEAFQNLNAQEYRYAVRSESRSPTAETESVLELMFKSRLVPMFQFAAFYDKDLEILPGPLMTLEGPVHTNGDLYLGSGGGLDILGQVTTHGKLFHGRKNADDCGGGGVAVIDPATLTSIPDCGGSRLEITEPDVVPWNEMIQLGVDELIVPPPEALDPTPGQIYWDKADLRVMMNLNGGTPVISVVGTDGLPDPVASAKLVTDCSAVSHTNSMVNNREGLTIDMLDLDMRATLDCIHDNALLGLSKGLDDTSEGGLVIYMGVEGPDADATSNNYGVRVRDGGELRATDGTAPAVKGVTVVTNQAAYVQGDFNATNKKPASFLADSLNLLSNNWSDANTTYAARNASDTTINAAFLSGTDLTGGGEGEAFQNSGLYNGGLENYPRFHENWSGTTLSYRGSFVSLNAPQRVDGAWSYGNPVYTAPVRDWSYDTDFNNAENLPPLSPRFVYLRQELFVRDFDL